MGRSASQQARRGWSENASAPSFESFSRRKPQFDDEFGQSADFKNEPYDPEADPELGTVRNYLPSDEIERKLATAPRTESGVAVNDDPWRSVLGCDEQSSEPAMNDVRDSGIRENEDAKNEAPKSTPDAAPRHELVEGPVDDPALSFRSYTLADLEKQGKPISIRPTRFSIVAEAQKPVTGTAAVLGEIAYAGGNVLYSMFGSKRSEAWAAFALEIRRGFKVLNWKKLTIGAAIGATTLLVLLLLVLTAAELTDDLKPARASGVQTTTASVKTIGQGTDNATPADPASAVVAPAPAPQADPGTIEIDDAPAPASPAAKHGAPAAHVKPGAKPAAPRIVGKKIPKSGDVFNP